MLRIGHLRQQPLALNDLLGVQTTYLAHPTDCYLFEWNIISPITRNNATGTNVKVLNDSETWMTN